VLLAYFSKALLIRTVPASRLATASGRESILPVILRVIPAHPPTGRPGRRAADRRLDGTGHDPVRRHGSGLGGFFLRKTPQSCHNLIEEL
jgi:hypothetical protein